MFREHYFSLKIQINSNTTTSFGPEKQLRGTDGPPPAKWRHSGASCSNVWRHIFQISLSVNLLLMVVYIYEFSLQSIKAMRFNITFPRTFWSPLVYQIDKKFWEHNSKYFLIHQFKHVCWLLKRTVLLRWCFWVPITYAWLRKSENETLFLHSYLKACRMIVEYTGVGQMTMLDVSDKVG